MGTLKAAGTPVPSPGRHGSLTAPATPEAPSAPATRPSAAPCVPAVSRPVASASRPLSQLPSLRSELLQVSAAQPGRQGCRRSPVQT